MAFFKAIEEQKEHEEHWTLLDASFLVRRFSKSLRNQLNWSVNYGEKRDIAACIVWWRLHIAAYRGSLISSSRKDQLNGLLVFLLERATLTLVVQPVGQPNRMLKQ